MTMLQVLDAIRKAVAQHRGDEKELLEQLVAEAEGWEMRLDELEIEEREEKRGKK